MKNKIKRFHGNIYNIFKWELTQRKVSTFWWIVGIGAMLSLIILIYPTFRDQAAQLDKSLQSIPESARNLFTDTTDFLSPIGYLSSQIYYLFLPLVFIFLSIGLGTSLIGREESQHTIELLLSRPISRSALLFGKLLAGLAIVTEVAAATALIGVVEVTLVGFKGVSAINILWVTAMGALLALIFGAVAFVLAANGKFGRGASIGISSALALAGYIFSSLDKTVTWLRWPADALPFHYYRPAEILAGHFTKIEALGMVVVIIILIVLSVVSFRRRDIE